MAAGIAVVLVLLFCSAMISGSEVAFFSLSPENIHKMNQKASRSSLLALSLLKMPEKLLAIILIANNFINVGIVIISNFVMKSIFDFWCFLNRKPDLAHKQKKLTEYPHFANSLAKPRQRKYVPFSLAL